VQGGGGVSTKRFLLQKILQLFLTLFLVTAITFILMQLSPIDAAEAYDAGGADGLSDFEDD